MSRCGQRAGHAPVGCTQNFLTCGRTIDRLLSLTDIGPQDIVWEIGAGKGHITRRLLARCGRLTAVEIDPRLHSLLAQRLGAAKGLRLLRCDFLEARLPATQAYKVFANLPFAGTTAMLRKLLHAQNPPDDCWLIMEKGAAKRFLGLPRENTHSLAIKPYYDGRILYHMRREDYHPAPAVDSVLVHFHRRETPDLAVQHREALTGFVQAMSRSLQGARGGPMTRRQASAILHAAGHADIPQSATLDYVQWLCLFRRWARLPSTKPCGKEKRLAK